MLQAPFHEADSRAIMEVSENRGYVIEAATEKMDVKKAIFRSLDAIKTTNYIEK